MFKRVALIGRIPINMDVSLLALRVLVFMPLFLKHGVEKLFNFGHMAQTFLDPVGIGPLPTLFIALIADGICSLLIVAGLFTRWATLYSFCNLCVAWSIPHHFALLGHNPISAAGEAIFLYMAVCITLFVAGAGRFSLDSFIERTGQDNPRNKNRSGLERQVETQGSNP